MKVRIIGKVIDEKYTRMLMARSDLDLMDVIALDKVQKGRQPTEGEFKSLKAKRLVEGRRPNLIVSAKVASATETVVDYLKKRGIDKGYCRRMVVELLGSQGQATRQDIDNLLVGKLSDALDDAQKRHFITNLLQQMRREGTIRPSRESGAGVPSGNCVNLLRKVRRKRGFTQFATSYRFRKSMSPNGFQLCRCSIVRQRNAEHLTDFLAHAKRGICRPSSCECRTVRYLPVERCANGYAGRTSRPATCWSNRR